MIRLLVSLFAFSFLSSAYGEETKTPLLAQFEGAWVSNGDAFGAPATTTMRWAKTLDGKFMRLEYRIEMTPTEGGPSRFEGTAYYQLTDGNSVRAFWADNAGSLHPVTATIEGAALVAFWGREEEGERGRSRYELLPSGDVEVTDWVKAGDDWRQFNHNVFNRVNE